MGKVGPLASEKPKFKSQLRHLLAIYAGHLMVYGDCFHVHGTFNKHQPSWDHRSSSNAQVKLVAKPLLGKYHLMPGREHPCIGTMLGAGIQRMAMTCLGPYSSPVPAYTLLRLNIPFTLEDSNPTSSLHLPSHHSILWICSSPCFLLFASTVMV